MKSYFYTLTFFTFYILTNFCETKADDSKFPSSAESAVGQAKSFEIWPFHWPVEQKLKGFLNSHGFVKSEPPPGKVFTAHRWLLGTFRNSEPFYVGLTEQMRLRPMLEGRIIWKDRPDYFNEEREATAKAFLHEIELLKKEK